MNYKDNYAGTLVFWAFKTQIDMLTVFDLEAFHHNIVYAFIYSQKK